MQVPMDLYWFLPAPEWRRFALTRHLFEVRGPGCYLQSKAGRADLWARSDEISATRHACQKGKTTQALAHVDLFGETLGDRWEPGFFAKELVEDLADTAFFPTAPADLNTYQVAGCGALTGLEYIFGVRPATQADALRLMRALFLDMSAWWPLRHNRPLKLHDIQFMLCQWSRRCKTQWSS